MTIRELLKIGKEALSENDTAELDSEVLLAYSLGVGKEYLFGHIDNDVDEVTASLFLVYIKRVSKGEPIAYILGEKEFYGISFFVDGRVLIPRPETELLVEMVLKFIRANTEEVKKFRILDVGTGSGNIAVSIAKSLIDAGEGELLRQIDAVDISEDALNVAKINVSQYGLDEVVHLYQSDLLENFENGENLDIIVANLPYIGEKKHNFVAESTKKFEPSGALYAGHNGLELYKKMFQQLLEENIKYRFIVGEFGFGQRKDIDDILSNYFAHNFKIEKDLAGIDRIFVISH